MDHADVTYLDAKRTVDDRALSRRVRDRLLAELPANPRILEAGSGTGTMVPRLIEWGIEEGTYRGIDRSERLLAHAVERRAAELDAERSANGFRAGDFAVEFEHGDALAACDDAQVDLLIASSFLDLVPIDAALDAFADALRPGGLVYAPLTFDGGTIFQPDHPADRAIEAAYHEHIDAQSNRDVYAGRHVIDQLRRRSTTTLAVAASDWIVRPRGDSYPASEETFLGTILEFVAEAVEDHPDGADWLAARRRQLEAAELSYVAHQYDVLYRSDAP